MTEEFGLIPVLRKQSPIWHLEVYGQPFCQHPNPNKELFTPCEIDLSFYTNDTLCSTLDRIESIIGIKPTLVKGNCPHTKDRDFKTI